MNQNDNESYITSKELPEQPEDKKKITHIHRQNW